jgi:hypothetical protein
VVPRVQSDGTDSDDELEVRAIQLLHTSGCMQV